MDRNRPWVVRAGWTGFPPWAERELDALAPGRLAPDTVLFRPGQAARAFVVVLSGRIDVFLTGPNGREVLLYTVEPGQSCVQTTLGLLGGAEYAGEAIVATPSEVVAIPSGLFMRLMDEVPAFRAFVFGAFAARMQDMLHLLERVAFQRVECRLAAALLALAEGGRVAETQSDLAARVGTAREVVTRQLDRFAQRGWVATGRGEVRLLDEGALRQLAAAGM